MTSRSGGSTPRGGSKKRRYTGFGSGQPTSRSVVTWCAGTIRVYVGWNWPAHPSAASARSIASMRSATISAGPLASLARK